MMRPLILTLSTAACLLSACSAEDSVRLDSVRPAGVGMEVLGASMDGLQAVSRAAATSQAVTEGSIGVFLANTPGGSEYDPKNNVCYTTATTGGVTTWSSDDGLFFNPTVANVCAYYPYVNDAAYADSKRIPLKTQLYDAAHDLSFAKDVPMNATLGVADGTSSGVGNKVKFSMTHAYALLELNISRGSSVKDDVTISAIKIAATGLKASNTLDITSGTYGSVAATTDGTFTLSEEITLSKGGSVSKKLLIIPTSASSTSVKFTFTLKKTGNPAMSADIGGITQFEKAKKYIVNLTVNGTDVETSAVEIVPWTEVTISNSGSSFIPLP